MTDPTTTKIPIRPCSAVVAQTPYKGQADGFDSLQGLQKALSDFYNKLKLKAIRRTPRRCPDCSGFMALSDNIAYGKCFPCSLVDKRMESLGK